MHGFVKVGRFTTLPEAQIAVGRLAAEGIAAHMTDAYQVQALPGAVGPIPVLVAAHDEAAALRVLATDYSDDLEGSDETT